MKVENLTITNFNKREFKIHTYVLDQNPELVEQKRPLAIVVPGGSFNHLLINCRRKPGISIP